jgi:signal transduction histidine kinase/DNA-binding response OmpR family regulator
MHNAEEARMNRDQQAKILVVDDRPENLLVYRTILEDLGQELVMAGSGEEALKLVLIHDFAVILLDVNMPGVDGFETAALIRRRKLSSHTPIIFITAFTDELRVAEGYAHGAVDFIRTPIVPPILRAKVKVFVDLFCMHEEVKRLAEERVAHAQERSKLEAAEESNRRLTFLARAGAVITKSLDRGVTIESILRLLVPEHCDQAVLAELDEAGRWHGRWARPGEETVGLPATTALADLPQDWRDAIQRALASGMTDHWHPQIAECAAPPMGLLALPLRERDRIFAVLLMVDESSTRRYQHADIAMFESVAWRSAIALTNSRLYHEIERADQQKNRFLSMLAHELRNPLAPIRSAVDVLQLSGDNPKDIEWARDVIDRQVDHLIRLVDDLLDISRVTLGKIRLHMEQLEAADLVNASVELSRPWIEKNRHQLSLSLPEQEVPLIGDRARLTQVLSNLLNNAAKYTPPGGRVFLSLHQEGREAVFKVRDTGIGIPRGMQDRVFEMFLQIDNALDRSQGGLGIGLTLVRELVNLHHGSIVAHSDGPGQGSEFTLRIPCAAGVPMRRGQAALPAATK